VCDGGAGMRDTEYIICAIVELNCNFFFREAAGFVEHWILARLVVVV